MNQDSSNDNLLSDLGIPSAGDGSSQRPRIVVIGSINMDLVVRTAEMPRPGQTVSGHNFATIAGGKGANQAVAASLCGANVSMIARVGNDEFSKSLLVGLKHYYVDISHVTITEGVHTGTAVIIVDDNGDNSICVAGGANMCVRPEDIDENRELIRQADLVLMQLEIPQSTVVYALQTARQFGVPVMINPSPIPAAIDPVLYEADILIANALEITRLSNEPVSDAHSAKLAGAALVARGTQYIIVTLGRRGAVAITSHERIVSPAFSVGVVDTTGAGDAFAGALAVAWIKEADLATALRFANAAGAIACSKFGAQPSMPKLASIQKLINRSC